MTDPAPPPDPSVTPDSIIRWYAQSALSGFDDLDAETAIANARSDLRAILAEIERSAI